MNMMFCIQHPDTQQIHREDPPYDFRDVPDPLPQYYKVAFPATTRINEKDWLKDIYDPIPFVTYELKQHRELGRVYVRTGTRSVKEIMARDPFYFLRGKQ